MGLDFLVLTLIALSSVLFLVLLWLYQKNRALSLSMAELSFAKASQSVKYGKLTEHWIPFSKDFPYSASRFRFVGNPIDGLVFDDQKIVFVEFKTASSQLNDNQKKVKNLVQDKKVEWLEFRVQ